MTRAKKWSRGYFPLVLDRETSTFGAASFRRPAIRVGPASQPPNERLERVCILRASHIQQDKTSKELKVRLPFCIRTSSRNQVTWTMSRRYLLLIGIVIFITFALLDCVSGRWIPEDSETTNAAASSRRSDKNGIRHHRKNQRGKSLYILMKEKDLVDPDGCWHCFLVTSMVNQVDNGEIPFFFLFFVCSTTN